MSVETKRRERTNVGYISGDTLISGDKFLSRATRYTYIYALGTFVLWELLGTFGNFLEAIWELIRGKIMKETERFVFARIFIGS